jgi:surface antigen
LLPLAGSCGGCAYNIVQPFVTKEPMDITGSIASTAQAGHEPTDGDMALARRAASDVLSRGGKDSSQPWENPRTGARGTVTPLATAYTAQGRTCRDFLASYVKGSAETWLQGEACKATEGRWEVLSMRSWKQG